MLYESEHCDPMCDCKPGYPVIFEDRNPAPLLDSKSNNLSHEEKSEVGNHYQMSLFLRHEEDGVRCGMPPGEYLAQRTEGTHDSND